MGVIMGKVNNDNSTEKLSGILIIADRPLVLDALSRVIDTEKDMKVSGKAADADGVLEAVKLSKPDLVIIDMVLSAAVDLIHILKDIFPNLPTVFLSSDNDPVSAVCVLRAGASGFIARKEDVQNTIDAIRRTLNGEVWVSGEMMPGVLRKYLETGTEEKKLRAILTKRELEIFELIGAGLSTEKIAKQLFISQRTVESHRDHIKKKLNIEDIVSLHKIAFQWVQKEIEM
jgi:DNA-binding NarL/FixJ family response regulator